MPRAGPGRWGSCASDRVGYASLSLPTGRVLGWFIEHKPSRVPALFGGIVRAAEHELEISPEVTKKSLRKSVVLDGEIEDLEERLREFFAVAFPPDK